MLKKLAIASFLILTPDFSFSWPFEEVNSWIGSYANRNINTEKKDLPYILKALPALQNKIPHISLGKFPTPVKKLPNLGNYLGVKSIYFKDDGLCSEKFGGNKVRKLEFLLSDAIYSGAKSIITIGDAGSNCVAATLISSKLVGFNDVYCVLGPQLNTSYLRRNLLLDLFYGGIIDYHDSDEEFASAVLKLGEELRNYGKPPYIVSWGGSCPIGFLGYMNAAFELKEQIASGLLPEPDYIYLPLGSTGTAGGFFLGAKLAGLKGKLIPVAISGKKGDAYIRTIQLAKFINEAIEFFTKLDPSFPIKPILPSELEHRENFANCTYAQVTEDVAATLKKLSELEGINLEGTYTGKSLTAMVSEIITKDFKDKNILFWNTFCYGKFEEITNKVSYKNLPAGLHKYFETDIQQYDAGL